MKKLTCSLLGLVLILNALIIAPASADFATLIGDVTNYGIYKSASEWAKPEIAKAFSNWLIPDRLIPHPDTGSIDFPPVDAKAPTNREELCEMAVLLYEKLTGKKAEPALPNPFSDTTNEQILKAFKLGITAGTSATTFSPSDTTNREQVATMFSRTIRIIFPDGNYSTDGAPVFLDQNDISSWALEHVQYMSKAGIILGSANLFMPRAITQEQIDIGYGTTTREQAIAINVRIYEKFKDTLISMGDPIEQEKTKPEDLGDTGTEKDPFRDFTSLSSQLTSKSSLLSINKNLFPHTESGSEFALKTTDKNMPCMKFLGGGYDVFGKYASSESSRPLVLDTYKLLEDSQIFRTELNLADFSETSSENARSYSKELSTSVGMSGNYMFFSASVSTNFGSSLQTNSKSYVSTIFYNLRNYKLYIKPTADLSKYVLPDVQNYLETKPPKEIFQNYGTHVLVNFDAGGRLNYNTAISSEYCSSLSEFSLNARAKFNSGFASASISIDTSKTEASETFEQNCAESIFTYGGNGIDGRQMQYDLNVFNNWQQSVKDNPSIAGFSKTSLVPIWEFCKSSTRKNYLQSQFIDYAKDKASEIPSSIIFNGLKLVPTKVRDTITDDLIDDKGDTWKYIGKISPYSDYPNEDIYALYGRVGSAFGTGNNAPIVDIIFENVTEGENALDYFNQVYKSDPTAKLWGYRTNNNIAFSNLGENLNRPLMVHCGANDVRLLYVTSEQADPITGIAISRRSFAGSSFQDSDLFPTNLDLYKKTRTYIKDRTEFKNGKSIIQNIGEGIKYAQVPVGDGIYNIWMYVYLGYTRD